MIDGRFPRLNDTANWASGGGDKIFVEPGLLPFSRGYKPVWIDNNTLAYGRDVGNDVWHTIITDIAQQTQITIQDYGNELSGGGGFLWIWKSNGTAKLYKDGIPFEQELHNVSAPRISKIGTNTAWLTPYNSENRTLMLNGRVISSGPIVHYDVSETLLVWSVATGTYTRNVFSLDLRKPLNTPRGITIRDWEEPYAVDSLQGPWVYSKTQDGIIYRPNGITIGYEFIGDHFDPQIAARSLSTHRLVASDISGKLIDKIIDLTAVRKDLTIESPKTFALPPSNGWVLHTNITVNLIPFFKGNNTAHEGSPNVGGKVYTHEVQSTYNDATGVICHAKNRVQRDKCAIWTYNELGLGLSFDATNELPKGYRLLNPGTNDVAAIYPAQMRVGESKTTPVEILNLDTQQRARYNVTTKLEGYYEPIAPHLPQSPTIVLSFKFDNPLGYVEYNYFNAAFGPWAWQEYKENTGSLERQWEAVISTQGWSVIYPPREYVTQPELPNPPEPPKMKTIEQFGKEFKEVNNFYTSQEGLQRPGGMVINGICDIEAMNRWGYELLANNKSVSWVIDQIKQSDEYKQKHPLP